MKNVIRNFVVLAVMSALTVSAFAQGAGPKAGQGGFKPGQGGPGAGGPGGGQRRGMGMRDDEIIAKLKLTAAQAAAVQKVKEEYKKKGEALRAELMKNAPKPGAGGAKPGQGGPGGGQRFQMDPKMREKFKSMMDGYQAAMKKAMGDAKFAEYQKLVKEAMEKRMKEGGFGGPGGPGAGRGAGAGAGKGGGKGGL